ncbi:MAG: hypothetical protein IJD40_12915 [Lachnospiraceae bacterium]|nr:hypothetical protein [Lachnospiraceae bacterium]
MAKLKSELDKWISIPDRDYLYLVEDHIMMTALRAAGIEQLPIYKLAQSILKTIILKFTLNPLNRNTNEKK